MAATGAHLRRLRRQAGPRLTCLVSQIDKDRAGPTRGNSFQTIGIDAIAERHCLQMDSNQSGCPLRMDAVLQMPADCSRFAPANGRWTPAPEGFNRRVETLIGYRVRRGVIWQRHGGLPALAEASEFMNASNSVGASSHVSAETPTRGHPPDLSEPPRGHDNSVDTHKATLHTDNAAPR
jgi:hypothetical protein